MTIATGKFTVGIVVNILGIPTYFSVWTLVMLATLWLAAFLYIQKMMPKEKPHRLKSAATVGLILSFLSVVVHEMGHGVVAYSLGEPIARAGTHALGAYVAPANSPFEIAPLSELLIVTAGPLVNALLGVFFTYLVWKYPESLAENTIQFLAYVNINLAWFNLFPVPVLDGGKIIDALSREITGMPAFGSMVYIAVFCALAIPLWMFLKWKPVADLDERLEDL